MMEKPAADRLCPAIAVDVLVELPPRARAASPRRRQLRAERRRARDGRAQRRRRRGRGRSRPRPERGAARRCGRTRRRAREHRLGIGSHDCGILNTAFIHVKTPAMLSRTS